MRKITNQGETNVIGANGIVGGIIIHFQNLIVILNKQVVSISLATQMKINEQMKTRTGTLIYRGKKGKPWAWRAPRRNRSSSANHGRVVAVAVAVDGVVHRRRRNWCRPTRPTPCCWCCCNERDSRWV